MKRVDGEDPLLSESDDPSLEAPATITPVRHDEASFNSQVALLYDENQRLQEENLRSVGFADCRSAAGEDILSMWCPYRRDCTPSQNVGHNLRGAALYSLMTAYHQLAG